MKKLYLLLSFSIFIFMTGCGKEETEVIMSLPVQEMEETPIPTVEPTPEPTEPPIETYELSLIATGDNLIHSSIYKKADNGDGTYDFHPIYEHIKETIQNYDLAVINQETIFIEDDSKVSSYPQFGTPVEMGDALVDTGFDIILNATNHTWDKYEEGGSDTLNFWKKYPDIIVNNNIIAYDMYWNTYNIVLRKETDYAKNCT